MSEEPSPLVMDADQVRRCITRLGHEIIERFRGGQNLALVGLRTRGVTLAQRLKDVIETTEGAEIPLGALDITLYRDDVGRIEEQPVLKGTDIPFDVSGKNVILVDDILYTGRTVRAALDALTDLGRPRTIHLAVFIDRGGREVPIQPDFVGQALPIRPEQRIKLRLQEVDGEERVIILPNWDA
jgi:pyrimidine operon attenuation protein/uracil phosphoribosyltransferase